VKREKPEETFAPILCHPTFLFLPSRIRVVLLAPTLPIGLLDFFEVQPESHLLALHPKIQTGYDDLQQPKLALGKSPPSPILIDPRETDFSNLVSRSKS
jgi:hypothetical protein